NPFSQLPDIRAALDILGLAHAETVCCEADDWFAAYAMQTDGDTQIVISSMDSDLFQLVSERVTLLRYRGKASQLFTPADVRERFGVAPAQFAAYKALVGDKSDNIAGVRGVGPKTAARLLAQHGGIAALLRAASRAEIAPPRLAESLLQSEEQLRAALAVIELGGEEPLPFSVQQLRYTATGLTSSQVLQQIFGV
ncbi:MAG: flap endonuclease, partial [Oscillospiraceae bacterium]|nr:flap endonuclease [Oscillospiraceae bacterium]